jgi:hypothetical protein
MRIRDFSLVPIRFPNKPTGLIRKYLLDVESGVKENRTARSD